MAVDQDAELETSEWLDAFDDVLSNGGGTRGAEIVEALVHRALSKGLHPRRELTTPYVNSIPPRDEPSVPGDLELEQSLRALVCTRVAMLVGCPF